MHFVARIYRSLSIAVRQTPSSAVTRITSHVSPQNSNKVVAEYNLNAIFRMRVMRPRAIISAHPFGDTAVQQRKTYIDKMKKKKLASSVRYSSSSVLICADLALYVHRTKCTHIQCDAFRESLAEAQTAIQIPFNWRFPLFHFYPAPSAGMSLALHVPLRPATALARLCSAPGHPDLSVYCRPFFSSNKFTFHSTANFN